MKSLIYPEALFIYNSESSVDTRFSVAGMGRERPWRNLGSFMVWVCGCSPSSSSPPSACVRHLVNLTFESWGCVALEVKANGSVNRQTVFAGNALVFKSIIFGIRKT